MISVEERILIDEIQNVEMDFYATLMAVALLRYDQINTQARVNSRWLPLPPAEIRDLVLGVYADIQAEQ